MVAPLTRRSFLRSAGTGLLVAAAAPVLAEVEPVRRFWQVGRNAPVGARTLDELIGNGDGSRLPGTAWHRAMEEKYAELQRTREMYENLMTLGADHAHDWETRAIAMQEANPGMHIAKARALTWRPSDTAPRPRFERLAVNDEYAPLPASQAQASGNERRYNFPRHLVLPEPYASMVREVKSRAELLEMYPDPEART